MYCDKWGQLGKLAGVLATVKVEMVCVTGYIFVSSILAVPCCWAQIFAKDADSYFE